MVFALLVAFLASVAGALFPPDALGQAIIEALPGPVAIPLIALLQHWAQRLLVLGVIVLYVIAGGATGIAALLLAARTPAVLALGSLPWVATVVLAQALAAPKVDLGGDLLGSAIGAAAFFAGLAFLVAAERVATPAGLARRRALLGAAAAAVVVALASTVVGGLARAATKVEPVAIAIRRLVRREDVPAADPAFDSAARITPRITANADHYRVDTTLIVPRVDTRTWKLEVAGAVEHPYSIGYDELLEMGTVERPHTLECISNEIGGDLTSTAVWAGVPMKDLLGRAVVRPDAYDCALTSVDGYTDSIRIAKALEPDTLVAYAMNGVSIPEEHGFPARALIPGIYGMKNVKWLARIEVVTYDLLGYWQERGWSDVAAYNTHTRIDTPANVARLADGTVVLAGIAFAGDRGVRRVEVSTNGGIAWTDALLEVPVGRLAWRRWRVVWTPPGPGKYTVVARATDGAGGVQTRAIRPPFPNGSTGYHIVEMNVSG